MAEAGVLRQHISAVLNYGEDDLAATRIYDRYSYDAEKRAALEALAAELSRVVSDKPEVRAANEKARPRTQGTGHEPR